MEQIYFACALAGTTVLVVQSLLGFLGTGGEHGLGSHDFGGHEVNLHTEVDGGDLHGGELQGAEHDVTGGEPHAGHGGHPDQVSSQAWFVGLFTFRTVLAAVIVFGFTGMATSTSGFSPANVLVLATGAGAGALYSVAWMMRVLYSLKNDGTVQIHRAVGEVGTVYLTVPGQRQGAGKVTVIVQNRTMEYLAVTDGETLPTGTTVQVSAIVDADTVEVVPALCLHDAAPG